MANLARRRRARDLWISRGHVVAAGLATVLLCGICFASGVSVGRSQSTDVVALNPMTVADGDLLQLIARVEATANTHNGIDKLTFPDALAGLAPDVVVPEIHTAASAVAVVGPGSAVMWVPDSSPPSGLETVEVASFVHSGPAREVSAGLKTAGTPAWVALDVVDGSARYGVLVEDRSQ